MKFDKTTTFCILPWTHSFINRNGEYQVCCTSEEYSNEILDENNKKLQIQDRPPLNDVMNSNTLKNLRLKMLNGDWSQMCTRCFETEKMGGVSRRIIENKKNEDLIENLVKSTKANGEIKAEYKSLDYRLGNLCNLQCRMCDPSSSKRWLKDWNQVIEDERKLSKQDEENYRNLDWIEKDFFLDEFNEKIFSADRIHFAGGEPLIAPQMKKILQRCLDLKISHKITLSYNTNITELPEEVLNLWMHFKEVKLLCSVDGFEKVNDYIRPPSKWVNIDYNLKFLDANAKKFNISEIMLSCTVQLYNVLSLEPLYNYLKGFQNIIPALNLINLKYPLHLSTQALPKAAKIEAEQRLRKIKDNFAFKLEKEYAYLLDNIDHVIRNMNEQDLSDGLLKFKEYDSKLNRMKGVRLNDYLPELNHFLVSFYFDKIEELENKKCRR